MILCSLCHAMVWIDLTCLGLGCLTVYGMNGMVSYLFGTRVPNLGALLGMLMVVGFDPGLEEGDESMLPLDCKDKTFKQCVIYNHDWLKGKTLKQELWFYSN